MSPRTLFLCSAALVTSATMAQPVLAQSASSSANDRGRADSHDREIVVTADFVNDLDILSASAVVSGEELVRDMRTQIGDVLTSQPGVSASGFAPGASRPVLRGFQGERIRVLTDGLGSLDVSNTSADHGVAIDPLTADRIEILRGPAVLLFGSQAIGGAVNVIDRRIPREVPDAGFRIDALGGYGSAADDRSIGGSADAALTHHVVVHVDGSYRRTGDLDIGGYVLAPALRAEQFAIAAEEREEGHDEEADEAAALANARGRLPNSDTRTWTAAGGIALVNDGGSLGVSVGWYDSRYGVPARPGAEHAHGEEEGGEGGEEEHAEEEEAPVSINVRQFRADMRGDVEVGGGFLDHIHVRGGFADYTHTEFEGTETGTIFNAEAFEGRIEFVQADRGGWRGVIGAQGFIRDFEAIGAEAFVPKNNTTQFGLFTLQEVTLGQWGLEIGARYERTDVSTDAARSVDRPDAFAVDRNFDTFSAAASLSYLLTPDFKIGLTGSRAERAPAAEELFAFGQHIATQALELGDPGFTTEKAWGAELFVRGELGPVHLHASAYAQWFDDYIYEVATGDVCEDLAAFAGDCEGLPVFQFRQAGARYIGFEGELEAELLRTDGFSLSGNLVADYVDARLDAGGDLPRIPPFRLLGGLSAQAGRLSARAEVEHSFAQRQVARFESETAAFTLVNMSVSWHPFADRRNALIVSANNIFDVDARRHTSFTKDFVPMAGRDVRVAVKFGF